MKKKAYRNTPAFVFLAWGSFIFFIVLILVGLYTLKEPLYDNLGCHLYKKLVTTP